MLLDTHAALWYALGDLNLSATARAAIDNESESRFISPASYWEIAIKVRLGSYKFAVPFHDFWSGAIKQCSYTILHIDIMHADKLTTLPMVHRDPFDRMLVAQCLCNDLSLVSNDSLLDDYGIRRIW